MNKLLSLTSILILFFLSCKKDKSNEISEDPESTNPSTVNTTPAFVPPQPGSLKINTSDIILHIGDNATLIATLYNSDGTISSSIPSLIWQSTNSSIANVSNGIIFAINEGNCEITVTDGIHGILRVNIKVLPIGVSVLNHPTHISWSFAGNVLSMQPNSTKTISNYQVYNSFGQVVASPTLTFVPPPTSGLAFSGNDVTSSSIKGTFEVMVKIGNDTLQNVLKVIVSAATDTAYSFELVWGTLPRVFYANNVTAIQPLLISVTKCWYNGTTPVFYTFITSPDRIEFLGGEDGVALNGQGRLMSVKPTHFLGGASLKISYRDLSVIRQVQVCINVTGTWGGALANGNSYNYCLTQVSPDAYYNSNEYYFIENYIFNPGSQTYSLLFGNLFTVFGTYTVIENGTQIFYGSDNTVSGTYFATTLGLQATTPLRFNYPNQNVPSPEIWGFSAPEGNGISKFSAGTNPILLRGAGNCGDNSSANWRFNGILRNASNNFTTGSKVRYGNFHSICSNPSLDIYTSQISGSGDQFTLSLNFNSIGSYVIDSNTLCVYDSYGGDRPYTIKSGILNITEYSSEYIGGTFNFNAVYDEPSMPPIVNCDITQGNFRVKR